MSIYFINMKSNLMQLYEKKLFTVNKSYHESFKHLSNEELIGLCDHNSLLEKVHKELKPSVTESDIENFNLILNVINREGHGFDDFKEAFLQPQPLRQSQDIRVDIQRFAEKNIKFERAIPAVEKLSHYYSYHSYYTGQNKWSCANQYLYKNNTNELHLSAVKDLKEGFSIENLTSYERFDEIMANLSYFLRVIWDPSDFRFIVDLCKMEPKYVFIVIYPLFLQPLGLKLWTILLPHFHFVKGSFLTLMTKLAKMLS